MTMAPQTPNDFAWVFGTLRNGLPGRYVDDLACALAPVDPVLWDYATDIWRNGQQARNLDPEVVELTIQLARLYIGKKVAQP
jgi:hypothetical protein